jgi:hypothetical protein
MSETRCVKRDKPDRAFTFHESRFIHVSRQACKGLTFAVIIDSNNFGSF